jgi:glycine hydroxymethyltransferase
VVGYPVGADDELIDMEHVRALALEHRPKMIIAGASAYARLIDFEAFRRVADEVGAVLLADIAHIAGLVAAKLHPDPMPHAHVVTTTTHKTLRGPRSGLILSNDPELGKRLDRMIFPGTQGGPLQHVIAGKAVAFFEALQPSFRDYARAVIENARALAAALADRGHRIVSGGTDNHLLLIDLRPRGMTGKQAVEALDPVRITVSKSMVPFDDTKPWITSGIRLGTPALTTRGFTVREMEAVADLIDRALSGDDPDAVRADVAALAHRHPMP